MEKRMNKILPARAITTRPCRRSRSTKVQMIITYVKEGIYVVHIKKNIYICIRHINRCVTGRVRACVCQCVYKCDSAKAPMAGVLLYDGNRSIGGCQWGLLRTGTILASQLPRPCHGTSNWFRKVWFVCPCLCHDGDERTANTAVQVVAHVVIEITLLQRSFELSNYNPVRL